MNDAKPPVLVTGGAGYIGSHAVLALTDAGWPVAVVDDLSTGFRFAVPDGVPLHEGDVADDVLLARIFAEQGTRAVLHFAGSIVVPESVADPLKYYRNNTAASRTLIEAAVAAGVPHMIFSSTAATYGVPEHSPIDEDTPTAPINPYGWSKLMTERMLADTAAARDLNYGVLRYFNVAGADPEGRSGQSTAGATHLIKVAVEAALGRRDGVAIFGEDYDTPDGTGVRDYIHVSDLAAAHVLALEALIARAGALADHELRLWARLLGARGARRGRPGGGHDARPADRATPGGRSGRARFRPRAHPRRAGLDGRASTISTRSSRTRSPGSASLTHAVPLPRRAALFLRRETGHLGLRPRAIRKSVRHEDP